YPRQPACQEVITLTIGQPCWFAPKQFSTVSTQYLHCAIGPTESLFFVVDKFIRHQTTAVAVREVHSFIPSLKYPQAEFSVFGNTPFTPPTNFFQPLTANHGHGAMLDNAVALITRDHTNLKKSAIFGEAHRFKCTFILITIILW